MRGGLGDGGSSMFFEFKSTYRAPTHVEEV